VLWQNFGNCPVLPKQISQQIWIGLTRMRGSSFNAPSACRFHKTNLQEFCQVAFRKKLYDNIDALQADLDEWLQHYNQECMKQGKMCCCRAPIEAMVDGKEIWQKNARAELDQRWSRKFGAVEVLPNVLTGFGVNSATFCTR
jgi:hypothetical protein